jgi:hypothetical protein
MQHLGWGCPHVEFELNILLSSLRLSVVFLSLSRQMPLYYLNSQHNLSLLNHPTTEHYKVSATENIIKRTENK